ncbi:MAG: 4Fe-4S dicluster domain-containing protein, partial [Myxococcales bacterium]|nr:4Fe-4S dicluster domain-containing protein [Myxococcales bacterium]
SSWNPTQGSVGVIWAGEPGSEPRRAGWRAAITAAGLGEHPIRLVDACTGEAYTNSTDGVAEVVAELERARAAIPQPLGVEGWDWFVSVGDPRRLSDAIGGWITLLDRDASREPMFVAGRDRASVECVAAFFTTGRIDPQLERTQIEGLSGRAPTRPTLARGRASTTDARALWLDESRCVGAADCARICPTGAITMDGAGGDEAGGPARPKLDPDACIRCLLCVERCEAQAWRPLGRTLPISGRDLAEDPERFASARSPRGVALHAALKQPPPRLDPRRAPATISRKPAVVLGLATVTLMEHAAALIIDGELVAAVEEERLARERHYSWKHPTRPGTSISGDAALRLDESWPQRAIAAVLGAARMTLDDVDLVALNGMPARFCDAWIGGLDWRPPPILRANAVVSVPHHMAHAASAYGLSDFDSAWILSVDGRGDYETATIWRAEGHAIEVVDAVPWEPDSSFGGVYETVTRVLGFGTHGQGSTMALAALGSPSIDLSPFFGLDGDGRPVLSERLAAQALQPYERAKGAPLEDRHRDLAASAQLALERSVAGYLERHVGASLAGENFAMCGGVALNCKMNGLLRQQFGPRDMYVTPGANDAGTAIGAALIGYRELTGELPRLGLGHSHLGPAWSDDAIAQSLQRMRVPFSRMRDVAGETA